MIRTVILASLLLGHIALAADPPAVERRLKPAELELLTKQKFVITGTEYKQIFTPYLSDDGVPIFITSDSILNAYHVLFEESVVQLERRNARRLAGALRKLLVEIPEETRSWDVEKPLLLSARWRAELVIGVALRLLDPMAGTFHPEAEKLIGAEVARIQGGKGTGKPEWLGKPDPGFLSIDYTRFVPVGIYTRSPQLQAYWRAINWLQVIPFRRDRDEELLAAVLLARAGRWAGVNDQFDPYSTFLGHGDNSSVVSLVNKQLYNRGKMTLKDLSQWRSPVADRLPRINDQLATRRESSLRIYPSYYLPDAGLFNLTGGPKRWPSGLDVAAALGSPIEKEYLTKTGPMGMVKAIEMEAKTTGWPRPGPKDPTSLFVKQTLHTQYLGCLQALLMEKQPDWPKFMTTPVWQWKQCQTALAGWALQRHTWALQAKRSVLTLGGSRGPVGFVEPVPAFYARLAELAQRCIKEFEGVDLINVVDDPGRARLIASAESHRLIRLESLANEITEAKLPIGGKEAFDKLPVESQMRLRLLVKELLSQDTPTSTAKEWAAVVAKLKEMAAKIQPELDGMSPELWRRWRNLTEIARVLALLSDKQLRNVPFTAEDDKFFGEYGKLIAEVMFHEDQAAKNPKDDAPRVASVFTNPIEKKSLQVGIARPREIFVLYPWGEKDKEVLCRGAVMTYREFQYGEPLTDEAWRKMLDGPKAPPAPDWKMPAPAPSSKKE